jgi:hypothetical protein
MQVSAKLYPEIIIPVTCIIGECNETSDIFYITSTINTVCVSYVDYKNTRNILPNCVFSQWEISMFVTYQQ